MSTPPTTLNDDLGDKIVLELSQVHLLRFPKTYPTFQPLRSTLHANTPTPSTSFVRSPPPPSTSSPSLPSLHPKPCLPSSFSKRNPSTSPPLPSSSSSSVAWRSFPSLLISSPTSSAASCTPPYGNLKNEDPPRVTTTWGHWKRKKALHWIRQQSIQGKEIKWMMLDVV
ncbi:hypothetical protein HMI54_005571 [Coelomomyces lativittatus]|nr:hypothetical protein HMI54_005571 [Coelomomyces lativittatus]KAJ1511587.1 hypothetical protein HMI56_005188 [Coelomomyces lativittatus]KAJ1515428.1 hypothetical protein HMI55_003707 [Coelomomyces lativittatus]